MNQILSSIAIPLLSAILAFVGAVAGSYVSADKAEDLWEKQERTVQLKSILNKRVELLERVSKVSNLTKKYAIYQSYSELQAQLAKDYVNCIKLGESNCVAPNNAKEVTEISLRRADLNAEFASTIQMVSLYYYCDAKQVANELGLKGNWWHEENEQLFRTLITAMLNEVANPDIVSCTSTQAQT